MITIKVVQSDKLYDLNFTLQDSSGNAIDLSNISTLLFKVQKENTTTLKFSGSMTVISAIAGTCKYTVQNNDFDEVGKYKAEIEVSYSSGQVITFTDIYINTIRQLPVS